eukprot:TRINITY_DN17745_c0_g1_i1.p1 TRINITY_DN17745_c0_g1~~TRINITY_DN17745_c0_g1_i1.p1  ORF type:complete len:289 (+),score=35.82 TRINITY_DN17745_c0_g1_i1:20-886(+)
MASLEERIKVLRDRITALKVGQKKPVLLYLNIRGIGWPIRILHFIKGIEFEDVQIGLDAWYGVSTAAELMTRNATMGVKSLQRIRHVPRYVDDCVDLQQSNTILLYLAKRYGMYANNEPVDGIWYEELELQEVMNHSYDCIFHFTGIFNANLKVFLTEEQTQSKLQRFLKVNWVKNLTVFQDYIERNRKKHPKSPFIVGETLTIGDLLGFNIIANWYKAFEKERFRKEFSLLEAYITEIAHIPRIKEFIQTKKECPTTWMPGVWGKAFGHRLVTPEDTQDLIEWRKQK